MKRLLLITSGVLLLSVVAGLGAWRLLDDDGSRRPAALTATTSRPRAPAYLNITNLQLSPSSRSVTLHSDFEPAPGGGSIDPTTEPVSIKLSTPTALFYSKTVTGFQKTTTGWSLSEPDLRHHGFQWFTIDRSSRGFTIQLVDPKAAIGAGDYSRMTVDLAIGEDSGSTEVALGEKPLRSGAWQLVTLQVPGQYPTIGTAIKAAAAGATIQVAAGTYREPLQIDKRLRIVGSREGRTELVSPSRDTGIVHLAAAGGAELSDLHFVGGAYAVGSDPRARGPALPGPVGLHHSSIAGGVRGVYGAFSEFTAGDVEISKTEKNGFSLTHVENFAFLFDTEVHDTGALGLYVNNHGNGDVTIAGHYHHNAYGGVQVSGSNGKVTLFLTFADHNGLFGVGLFDADAGIGLSALEDQMNAPLVYTAGDCEGVGILAIDSVVSVSGTRIEDNCVGVASSSSSSLTITQSIVSSTDPQRKELIATDGSSSTDAWANGNVCGYSIDAPGESVVECSEFASGPPQAPEPYGPGEGLE